MGETNSEHLMVWCPAVSMAAEVALGAPPCQAVAAGRTREATAGFLHQVSFLALSLDGRATMAPHQAASWLHRATARDRGKEDDWESVAPVADLACTARVAGFWCPGAS